MKTILLATAAALALAGAVPLATTAGAQTQPDTSAKDRVLADPDLQIGSQRPSTNARTQPPFVLPPLEQELQDIKEEFRKAKTPQKIQSVKLYCRDTIAAHSFENSQGLLMKALSLIQQNKNAEANKFLAQAMELDRLDANLTASACKAPGE